MDCICPHCGRLNTHTSGVNSEAGPEPGAYNICINCGEISVYKDDLTCRKIEDTELFELMLSSIWPKIDGAIKQIKARGKQKQ